MEDNSQVRRSASRGILVLAVSLAAFVVFGAGAVFAQSPEVLRDPLSGKVIGLKPVSAPVSNPPLNQLSSVVGATEASSISDAFIATYKDIIGLSDPGSQLTALPTETDDAGINHTRYYQTHLKLGVLGAEVIVHVDPSGQVTLATTKVARNLPARATTKVSAASAKQTALNSAATELPKKFKVTAKSSILLIVPLDIFFNSATPDSRLAWEVKVDDTAGNGRVFSKNYYVDAISGQVVLATSNIAGLDRSVYDCASPDSACHLDFLNAGYWYGRSESAPPRGPSPRPGYVGSLDVDNMHSILGTMHNFVNASFGLNGANNQGGTGVGLTVPASQTRAYAHFDTQSSLCIAGGRAQFVPSTGEVDFCKGNVVTDMVGHEYSHAIVFHSFTDINGNPIGAIYYGQSGALDEAFADFMGEALENSTTGSNDWLNGAGSTGGPVRNLANPSAINYATNTPYPRNFYSSTMYCNQSGDNNGVHINSTIISHAFYRLAVGGDEIGCDIAPIGIEAAKQIFYRSWRHYFSRTVTFAEAYNGIQQACADLYPSVTCEQVTKALQAAEINQPGKCGGQPEPGPTCAVRHVTNAYTAKPTYFLDDQWSPQTLYSPGETLRVLGWGNDANRNIKLFLKTAQVSAPVNYLDLASGTFTPDFIGISSTGPNGEVDFAFANPLHQNSTFKTDYWLFIDGNSDGLWEPWADTLLSVQIKQVVNGDGVCYHGQLYSTSETCMNSPVDCACLNSNYRCQDISGGMPPGPYHYCVYNP